MTPPFVRYTAGTSCWFPNIQRPTDDCQTSWWRRTRWGARGVLARGNLDASLNTCGTVIQRNRSVPWEASASVWRVSALAGLVLAALLVHALPVDAHSDNTIACCQFMVKAPKGAHVPASGPALSAYVALRLFLDASRTEPGYAVGAFFRPPPVLISLQI